MRHCRASQCREINPVQRADQYRSGGGRKLPVLYDRAKRRTGSGAGTEAGKTSPHSRVQDQSHRKTRFFKLQPSNIIVFCDEIDLAPGRIKAKLGGGHAGHNGLRDIVAQIGPQFHRIRMGVGHPGDKELVSPHVLSDFSKNEQCWLVPLLDSVAAATPWLVEADPARFLTEVALLIRGDAKSPDQEL